MRIIERATIRLHENEFKKLLKLPKRAVIRYVNAEVYNTMLVEKQVMHIDIEVEIRRRFPKV